MPSSNYSRSQQPTGRDVANGLQRNTEQHKLGDKIERAFLEFIRRYFPNAYLVREFGIIDVVISPWHRIEIKGRPSLWRGYEPLYDPYLPDNKARWATRNRATMRVDAVWTDENLTAFLYLPDIGYRADGLPVTPAKDRHRTKNREPVREVPLGDCWLIYDRATLIERLRELPYPDDMGVLQGAPQWEVDLRARLAK